MSKDALSLLVGSSGPAITVADGLVKSTYQLCETDALFPALSVAVAVKV